MRTCQLCSNEIKSGEQIMSDPLLITQDEDCDKIYFALKDLKVPSDIVYTGGGFYFVVVKINYSLEIEINKYGATLNDPQTGNYFAILSGETKPKAIAKQIAGFYKLNK